MEAPHPARRRVIASYVGPRAFAAHSRAALESLGYEVIAASTRGAFDDPSWPADLRLIDERHLGRLPDSSTDPTPIVLLCGSARDGRRDSDDDPRIVAHIQRPARLRDLYGEFQRALEPFPRRAPRVATELAARGISDERRFVGAVRSLSEYGCLFQGAHGLRGGDHFNLQIAIPSEGVVTARGRCVHAGSSEVGVEFVSSSQSTRDCIGEFVLHRLSSHPTPSAR